MSKTQRNIALESVSKDENKWNSFFRKNNLPILQKSFFVKNLNPLSFWENYETSYSVLGVSNYELHSEGTE